MNPTAAEVVAARDRLAGTPTPAVPPLESLEPEASAPWPAMVWTMAACVVCAGLALANPTTTYHLAPVVALLCWPVIDRGRRPRGGWRPGLLAAAGATILVAVTILFLVSRQALDGPALIGPNATGEAFALTAIASG